MTQPGPFRQTTGEACIRLLEQFGVDTVFGIPGVHTLEMYRGLARSPITHVTPRHEQGAGFMADGYARVSGRPGVCLVITGPGLTNVATPVASAYHDSQPLLLISSATSTDAPPGSLHKLPDQQALMSTITAKSIEVTDASQLADAFANAWQVFESGRPRPVHIGIPVDVLAEESSRIEVKRGHHPRPLPSEPEVLAAAEYLALAQRPMLILGGGSVDAGAQVVSLAERVGAPVVMTINAKGTLRSDHPLSLGTTLILPTIVDELEGADVVLAVGTELSEIDFYYSRRPEFGGTLIVIDIDADELRRWPESSVRLHGDAAQTLARLDTTLQEGGSERRASDENRAAEILSRVSWWEGSERFLPIIDALGRSFPTDVIVAADSNQLTYVANNYMPAWLPRSWLSPGGFGALGPALPMAIGAKIAAPDRPVVAIVGDGGFLFTIQELGTAADLRLPIVVLLWNNDGYGEIRDAMAEASITLLGTDISARDFSSLAEGFGCRFLRARSLGELEEFVSSDLASSDGPVVIELRESSFVS